MRDFGYFEEGYEPQLSEKRLWRRLITYLGPFLIPFGGAVILSLLVTGATLGLPWLMQQGIDLYIVDSTKSISDRSQGLTTIAFMYGVVICIHFFAVFSQVLILEWIGQSIMQKLRQQLFSHLLGMDLGFFHEQPVGRLVTRLTNDVQNMHEMFTSVMVTLFNDLLRMAGILALLIYVNYRLGLVMTLFLPLAAIITILFSRLARTQFRRIRRQLAKLNAFIQETVSGVLLVQLFGRAKSLNRRFSRLNNEYLNRTLGQIKLFGTFMPLTELMSSLAIGIILWYGGGEIIRQRLTLGELVAFLSYMRLFFQPLRELSQKYSIVQSALASAERIFHLIDSQSAEKEDYDPAAVYSEQGKMAEELIFEQVNFGYKKGEQVLFDVSFSVRRGETVAIVGPTGSGKSTLINLLLRFYEPDSGRIVLGVRPLIEIPRDRLRRLVGVVMQESLILQDSLLANIVLDSGKKRTEVEELLEKAQLREFVAGLPEGLDTRIGEGGRAMSSGEKQLLAIARVLCREPSCLVLDEASSAIDSRTEELVEQALVSSFQDKTVLIIAHRLSTVQRADRVIVLEKGRVVEQGSHRQLISMNGIYNRLVQLDLAHS